MKKHAVYSYRIIAAREDSLVSSMLFYAPDNDAAAKVARFYIKTMVAATKHMSVPLTKDMFSLKKLKNPVNTLKK